jgi:hypothetical protein
MNQETPKVSAITAVAAMTPASQRRESPAG